MFNQKRRKLPQRVYNEKDITYALLYSKYCTDCVHVPAVTCNKITVKYVINLIKCCMHYFNSKL